MRIAPLIFGGFTALVVLTAPALAKNSQPQKIDEQPASRSSHARHDACCNDGAEIRRARRAVVVPPLGQINLLTARQANQQIGVQPHSQKYSGSLLTQITSSSSPSRPNTEGRFAIVTNVGHGMRWTRWHQGRMALTADGEVVWS